ncbi:MAG: hypothetical protein IPH88_17860 [Bacteroidales bacterium]|nr:hypothetical protein [Bacteroidales bacterium]
MKTRNIFISIFAVISLSGILAVNSCSSQGESKNARRNASETPEVIKSNIAGSGQQLEISFVRGTAHNHPTFAIWLENAGGEYVQTLFVTRAIGQGVFNYGDRSGGKWKPGEVRRPAALPYWSHKRNIKAEDGLYIPSPKNPVADAYSGATPKGSFTLQTRPDQLLKGKLKVMLEINQTWDWNQYWTNSMYTDDFNYKTSCQPALVYEGTIDLDSPGTDVELLPVGHSHYSGKDGSLNTDLSTITTALQILKKVSVKVISQ